MSSPNNRVTPTTGVALRKTFQLLEDNFDPKEGRYSIGWSDEKIAKETGISEQAVKDYRSSAFGNLKPPNDLYKAKQDLDALESLFLKNDSEFRAAIKDLKQRILQLQRKFD